MIYSLRNTEEMLWKIKPVTELEVALYDRLKELHEENKSLNARINTVKNNIDDLIVSLMEN